MKKYVIFIVSIAILSLYSLAFAVEKQNAEPPGEQLASNGASTTAIQMSGTFAVEISGTGTGTILIKRSENGNTNWLTIKTVTYSGTDKRFYLYENFGEQYFSKGAYYKAVASGSPASPYFYVRLVK